jgi:hypothetical protein
LSDSITPISYVNIPNKLARYHHVSKQLVEKPFLFQVCKTTMMLFRWTLTACLATLVTAYQPGTKPPSGRGRAAPPLTNTAHVQTATAAATAALSLLLLSTTPLPATAANLGPASINSAGGGAAQISLNALPPGSISVQIRDLPVIGDLVSGTYSKVPDGSIAKPSVTITSPKDIVKALQSIVTAGHLEFDVKGILTTHLNVDVASDEPGVAKIRVASNLIPKLPFRNLASGSGGTAGSITGGKESMWNVVTNMGSGESYYFNEKTGLTQFERPAKF